jgi:CDP-diacylglycerol--serine O-phosphatidyltransferase
MVRACKNLHASGLGVSCIKRRIPIPLHGPTTHHRPAPLFVAQNDDSCLFSFACLLGLSGSASIFSSMKFLVCGDIQYLYIAIALLPFAFVCDVLDGRIARWRHEASQLGQELDSLADLVSFGVAPAVIGFAVGCQSFLDVAVLLFFIGCGISRLARYNTTAEIVKDPILDKVTYFEGTPIPTTVAIALGIGFLLWKGYGSIGHLPFGQIIFTNGWTFHPFVAIYAISGVTMVSKTLKIPKP